MKSNNIISYLKLVICILSAIVSAGLMACIITALRVQVMI